jgi:hypothetical protein
MELVLKGRGQSVLEHVSTLLLHQLRRRIQVNSQMKNRKFQILLRLIVDENTANVTMMMSLIVRA